MKKNKLPGRARALVALGTVLGIGAVATLAVYSDSAQFDTKFSTGTVDIALEGTNEGKPEPYDFSLWSKTEMVPGTEVYAKLIVNNKGTGDFTYTMPAPTFPTDEEIDLRTAIRAGVRLTSDCGKDGYDAAADKTVVADGELSAMKITEGRALAAKTSETLCFYAALPADAPNSTQGKTVTPTFMLNAVGS